MAQHIGAVPNFLPNGGGKGTPEPLGDGQKWASIISELLRNLSFIFKIHTSLVFYFTED